MISNWGLNWAWVPIDVQNTELHWEYNPFLMTKANPVSADACSFDWLPVTVYTLQVLIDRNNSNVSEQYCRYFANSDAH